jgi:hypothetical protein
MTSTPHLDVPRFMIRVIALVTAVALALMLTGCQQRPASQREPRPDRLIELTNLRRVLLEWNDITNATWSNRNTIAFTTQAGEIYRADLAMNHPPIRVGGIDSGALGLAADPNGRVVAVSGLDELVAWTSNGNVLLRSNLSLVGANALAIDDAGHRLVLGSFSLDVFQLEPYRRVSSGRQPEPTLVGYGSLVFAGNRVAGRAHDDNLDVWDVSRNSAVLTRHDCHCGAVRVVIDPAARSAVFATSTGQLILWDIDQARAIANETLITSAEQSIEPFAVVADRLVLFSVDHPVPGGQGHRGPLQAWDTITNTVTTVWDCPGCEVRQIVRQLQDDNLLIYSVTSDAHLSALWTAALRR